MSKRTLAAQVSDHITHRFDEYREEEGFDTQSEAVRELLDAGLDEWERDERMATDGGYYPQSVVSMFSARAAGVSLSAATISLVMSLQWAHFLQVSLMLGVTSLLFAAIYLSEVGVGRISNRFGGGH